MNVETERAYITDDVVEVRKNLAAAGFLLVNKEEQVNLYMDHPFLRLIEQKKYIRVRWINGWSNVEISFSSPVVDSTGTETRPQYKKEDKQSVKKILELLKEIGFIEALVLEKDRELFTVDGKAPRNGTVHVEMDTNITIHPRDISTLPKAKHHDVRLEDTVQICIETDGPSSKDLNAAGNAKAFGLLEKDITLKNYFERYFEMYGN